MADLTVFSKEERGFLISIPYRVGVWISEVDDNTDSRMDDVQERRTLEKMISNLAAKSGKIPFGAAIMRDIENNKSVWPAWQNACAEERILGDIEKAIRLCKSKISDAELAQFKKATWQIGIMVAQAYGEHVDPDNEMHVDRFFKWLGSLSGSVKLDKNPENLSKAEKVALNKLRAILKE